jgi:hypothetical protein
MKKSFDLQKSNNNLPKLFLVLSLLFLFRGKLCISKKQTLNEKTNNAAESRNQSNKEEVMNKWDPEKLQEFIENIETVKVIDLENKLFCIFFSIFYNFVFEIYIAQ